jgi:hypothetical protein
MPALTTKPAKLHESAHARLKELQAALKAEGVPGSPDQVEILSALVLYTTAPQVAGMLTAYARYTSAQEKASG